MSNISRANQAVEFCSGLMMYKEVLIKGSESHFLDLQATVSRDIVGGHEPGLQLLYFLLRYLILEKWRKTSWLP